MSGIVVNYKKILSVNNLNNNYKDTPSVGSNNWKVVDLSSYQESALTFKNSRNYFTHKYSYTEIPKEIEVANSSLTTQFIFASAVFLFGKIAKKMFTCEHSGLFSGAVIGGTIGAIIGGVGQLIMIRERQSVKEAKDAVGVGGAIGGLIGGSIGFCSDLIRGDLDLDLDPEVAQLYKDFKILKNAENVIDQSMKQTNDIAHEFFINYLESIDKDEMGSKIFCPISKDIMIIPVKTNCGHVFELISLTNVLKGYRNCPLCTENIKEAYFDFTTCKAIKDALKEALSFLEKTAGKQNLLLLRKHFKEKKFANINDISFEKIKKGDPISLVESKTLYCIVEEYSKNHKKINKYIKQVLGLVIQDNYQNDKINLEQLSEMNKKLKDWV